MTRRSYRLLFTGLAFLTSVALGIVVNFATSSSASSWAAIVGGVAAMITLALVAWQIDRAAGMDDSNNKPRALQATRERLMTSPSEPILLDALASLERIAERSPWLQQPVVDAICDFIRYQSERTQDEEHPPTSVTRAQLEAQNILTRHLRRLPGSPAPDHWPGIDLDLRRCALWNFDFRDCIVDRSSFERTVFYGHALFHAASFRDRALFSRVVFRADADFAGAYFGGESVFDAVVFREDAQFSRSQFGNSVNFVRSVFESDADFSLIRVRERADFNEVIFSGIAKFDRSSFMKEISFADATFSGPASFAHCSFDGQVSLDKVRSMNPLNFDSSTFYAAIAGAPEDPSVRWASFKGTVFAQTEPEQNAESPDSQT